MKKKLGEYYARYRARKLWRQLDLIAMRFELKSLQAAMKSGRYRPVEDCLTYKVARVGKTSANVVKSDIDLRDAMYISCELAYLQVKRIADCSGINLYSIDMEQNGGIKRALGRIRRPLRMTGV